jgi:hypothetical protein
MTDERITPEARAFVETHVRTELNMVFSGEGFAYSIDEDDRLQKHVADAFATAHLDEGIVQAIIDYVLDSEMYIKYEWHGDYRDPEGFGFEPDRMMAVIRICQFAHLYTHHGEWRFTDD